MTLYLTDDTPADEIRRAKAAGVVALKLYPAGATTNSSKRRRFMGCSLRGIGMVECLMVARRRGGGNEKEVRAVKRPDR